ncbi:hypothetical protein [Mesorhizobium sp. INR15]|uniref:hypothetical protein n=1 Tax=Mesorhizobium sp. INR15 TaxID=2654248 RepID=UPI0018967C8A|nr:hypothetical protein [Mesorhizobium sp. INR15]QPC95946.1 hypothetical protein GA829_36150 [Mesorhizobium sp. INR15]
MMSLKKATILAVLLLICSAAAAQDRPPDAGGAEAAGAGAVRAWYGRPTIRYAHGVLGDAIEAGSLIAIDEGGRRDELVVPQTQVFEDITARLADLDGDGHNEVVAIAPTFRQALPWRPTTWLMASSKSGPRPRRSGWRIAGFRLPESRIFGATGAGRSPWSKPRISGSEQERCEIVR